jgi:hypothetical protein
MIHHYRLTKVFAGLVVIHGALIAGGQELIRGVQITPLSGPVTPQIAAQAEANASRLLRKDLVRWLREAMGNDWNCANRVDSIHAENLLKSLKATTRRSSSFEGRNWVLSYTMQPDSVLRFIDGWNENYVQLRRQNLEHFSRATGAGDISASYHFGVKAAFYHRAIMGPMLATTDAALADSIARVYGVLSELLESSSLSSSAMIIEGKPGNHPVSPVSIGFTKESKPLIGVHLQAVQPNGSMLFSRPTDSQGGLSLDSITIPYVTQGSFLTIRPACGREIDSTYDFSLLELTDALQHQPEHRMMFKISSPAVWIDYQVSGANNIVVPENYRSSTYVMQFLKDSCSMVKAANAQVADVHVTVRCQVSQYDFDKSEESILKVDLQVEVVEQQFTPPHQRKEIIAWEKPYKLGVDIPLGLFFWETSRQMQRTIKAILDSI